MVGWLDQTQFVAFTSGSKIAAPALTITPTSQPEGGEKRQGNHTVILLKHDPEAVTHYFYLHPTGQNLVTQPHFTVREAEKFSLQLGEWILEGNIQLWQPLPHHLSRFTQISSIPESLFFLEMPSFFSPGDTYHTELGLSGPLSVACQNVNRHGPRVIYL